MRVLFDTNIFVERENYHIVPENIQKLLKLLNILKVEILIHPKSVEEINRDQNTHRKEITLSKIRTYSFLDLPPNPLSDKQFMTTVGRSRGINDDVDNVMLYAVFRNSVDFLVTEDKGIQNKALKISLADRVLSSDDALNVFRKFLPYDKIKRPPSLKEERVYNLKQEEPFFDTLREEYSRFNEWLKKVSKEGRKCWVYREENGLIGALLIFKSEITPINSTPPLSAKPRLKLCTFKVTHTGFKIGELLIRLSVEYCINNDLAEMYLTHFTKPDDMLSSLIEQYGFVKVAKIGKEDVYLKKLIPDKKTLKSLRPFDVSRIYYPSFYDDLLVKKFIVPIQPKYHNRLFIGYGDRQTTIPEHSGEFIVEGNTISKVYLSHSRIGKISKGDLLLFYRSRDKRELTSIGVVEKTYSGLSNRDIVARLVGKRTVYSYEEIETLVEKPILALFFRFHFHLPNPLKFIALKQMKILNTPPQSIITIPHRNYLKIKKMSGLDERYTFN